MLALYALTHLLYFHFCYYKTSWPETAQGGKGFVWLTKSHTSGTSKQGPKQPVTATFEREEQINASLLALTNFLDPTRLLFQVILGCQVDS